jgi:uncharacterized protein YyaL (SSP411 family)
LSRLGPAAGDLARQLPLMLANLAAWHGGIQQIVIVGNHEADDTRAMRRVVARHYLPFTVQVPVEPGAVHQALSRHLPWLATMTLRDGRPTAYVCRQFACEAPVTSAEALEGLLMTSVS